MNVGDLVTFPDVENAAPVISPHLYANLKDVDYGVIVKFVRTQTRPFRNGELSASELQLLLESSGFDSRSFKDNVWNVRWSNGKQCLHYECDLARYE